MKTVNGGADINAKDFCDWTPLHCAAYLGQTKFLKYLLKRPLVLIYEKNDDRKTPIILAIEAGNVFDEVNVCISFLERGYNLEEDVWHYLLILSLNYIILAYPNLAFRQDINIYNIKDETKISLNFLWLPQSLLQA